MKKIYIAGPMRGYPNYNFDAFDAACAKLRAAGFVPINPADLDRLHEGWGKYPPETFVITPEAARNFRRRDIAAIEECTHIYMLQGWRNSTGAMAEHTYARWCGLEVIFEEDDGQ